MPYTQHYFIGSAYHGSAERGLVFNSPTMDIPVSYAHFCPHCGEVWARVPVEKNPLFQVSVSHCVKHPEGAWKPAGSILHSFDMAMLDTLPSSVLAYELEIHINHYLYRVNRGETKWE